MVFVPDSRITVPADTEAARSFYQQRVALFSLVIGGLGFAFFAISSVLVFISTPFNPLVLFEMPAKQLHLAAVAAALSCFAIAAKARLTERQLALLDIGGTALVCGLFTAMGLVIEPAPYTRIDLILTLILALVLLSRAVLVPSSARRTLLTWLLCTVPLLYVCWDFASRMPMAKNAGFAATVTAYVALWSMTFMVPATLASRVIYGLRQQVREALQLGQYTLVERIGHGGMGTVYRAKHAMLRRPTAIKLLPPSKSGESAIARFEREVQITSRLTHPNTVAIYDYGRTPDGVFYYAMEYLDGLDLARVVELDGAQPPARVIHVLGQVLAALSEAHAVGLVHRDIKPANVILCERGGVPDFAKVVDFGLVKHVDAEAGDPALSTVQAIIGTPLFMPPEAIRSPSQVDARSDLYAVGALGYYLLTGTPVFNANTTVEICSHHLHSVPERPSTRVAQSISEGLEKLVLQCLEKDPARRPESASTLRSQLLALGGEPWTEAQARDWWQRIGPVRRARGATDPTRPAASPSMINVAWSERSKELS